MTKQTDFKYWPVNWTDGMLLNKGHLAHQDAVFNERVCDAIRINQSLLNYGILPRQGNSENCIVNISVDGQTLLKVKVDKCLAVTPNGLRISIPGEEWELANTSVDLKNFAEGKGTDSPSAFYVTLAVNPGKFVPFGTPDPEEEPPRFPYLHPCYNISLIPANDIDMAGPGGHILPIAMLTYQNNQFQQSEGYIPPCTSIQSHGKLTGFVQLLQKNLRALETSSITIVQKVRGKHQENILALGINSMAEQIMQSAGFMLQYLSLQANYAPVIDLLVQISALARSLRNKLDTWQGIGKEEILTYMAEWCNLNQGEFESTISELVNMEYKHHNMAVSLQAAEKLFNILAPAFTVLAELDYIGKKIDTDLFVKEEIIETGEYAQKTKKGGIFRK
ncbi:MAG: type VI secretion system baseplate subunit TssK [Bacteroidales bacterium]|nr:type VI secretion system baseplate subunit TssK [Bacteroidales bacterium]